MNRADFFLIKKILEQGGLIAYPTETVYGLGCDPFQEEAVKKIFKLKGRGHSPLMLIPDREWLHQLVEGIPSHATELMEKFWPGPLTVALKASQDVPIWLRHTNGTVAFRISSHRWVQEFLSFYNRPLLSTSANRSGQNPLKDIESIKKVFSDEVDYYVTPVIPAKAGIQLLPSTIISFHDNKLHFIREGVIPFKSIAQE